MPHHDKKEQQQHKEEGSVALLHSPSSTPLYSPRGAGSSRRSYGCPSARPSRTCFIKYFILLALVSLTFSLSSWLLSVRRAEEVDVRRISCSEHLPWYYFFQPSGRYYSHEEAFVPIPAVARSNGLSLSIVQVCSNARKWYLLDELVDNHRKYAVHHGFEYDLKIDGKKPGVWDKIQQLRDKIQGQLKLSNSDGGQEEQSARLDWIFYTDIDSYIPNPLIDARVLLPPNPTDDPTSTQVSQPGVHPFLLVTSDHNGFNAGNFFIRVCLEALEFLDAVLAYEKQDNNNNNNKDKRPVVSLPFAEQSAMQLVMEEKGMREGGQVAFLPQPMLNSYMGEEAIIHAGQHRPSETAFNLHFPNFGRKRLVMLPMLAKIRSGEISLPLDRALLAKKAVEDAARHFWAGWKPGA